MHVIEALGIGGGVENGIANLVQRMDPRRFEHVLCAVFRVGPQTEQYIASNVSILNLEQKARKCSVQVGPLARALRQVRPDIVHSRNWGALEAVAAGRFVQFCSVIHSEHGFEVDPATEPRRRQWIRRAAFELAHGVFSVSYQLRNMLARRTGFSARKIGVIHNGVNVTRFRQDRAAGIEFRRELGISDEEFCIGCVGRLNRIKDYPTMLRAAEVFSRSCDSWRLVIAGSGSELGVLQGMVDSNPALRGRVHFLGSTTRIPEFLNAIDVYVLPSICEGISNSLLEAMATGLPVIVSDTGGNPEVVDRGGSGLLFRVGDSDRLAEQLLLLYRDRAARVEFGRQALRRVHAEFSLDSMIRQYEEMYTGFAQNRAAGRAVFEREIMQTDGWC
jgi:sugar transferase (PEP-CTERM/EpsH1 system associated)